MSEPANGEPALIRAALASDALDRLGVLHHCLRPGIVPINLSRAPSHVLVGRAYTARAVPMTTVPESPYVTLLQALDGIGRGEVFVLATDRVEGSAFWGELLSTACLARGAAGAITDGFVRDIALLVELSASFPVFGRGGVPYDIHPRFEIAEYGKSVDIDGITIEPGALIVADLDGVVVVPPGFDSAVLDLVAEKAGGESAFRSAVANGELPSVAFAKYGVL